MQYGVCTRSSQSWVASEEAAIRGSGNLPDHGRLGAQRYESSTTQVPVREPVSVAATSRNVGTIVLRSAGPERLRARILSGERLLEPLGDVPPAEHGMILYRGDISAAVSAT
jgi:hypothetical protein